MRRTVGTKIAVTAAVGAAFAAGMLAGPAWASPCFVTYGTIDPWPNGVYPFAMVDGGGSEHFEEATANAANVKAVACTASFVQVPPPGDCYWVSAEAWAYALAESQRQDNATIVYGGPGLITGTYTWKMWGSCGSAAETSTDFGSGSILCEGVDDANTTRSIDVSSEATAGPETHSHPAGSVSQFEPASYSIAATTGLTMSAFFTFYGKACANSYKTGKGSGWGDGAVMWSTVAFVPTAVCP